MNKKLLAKVQQLNPGTAESVQVFAGCVVTEPEDKNLTLRKGYVYAVFSIKSTSEFKPTLVRSIVADVLQNAYYSADSISVIQSLEKALAEVVEKLGSLAMQDGKATSSGLEFNMVASALWGNVLYIVKYGSGLSYLVRSGEIRPINTLSEGSFSAASGVLKDDDVVMLSTEGFGNEYPPDKLLSMSLKEDALKADQACILLKFVVDTTFTEEEVIDFGVQVKSPRKLVVPAFVRGVAGLLGRLKKKKLMNVSTISEEALPLKVKRGKVKLKPAVLILAVGLALSAAIVFTVYRNASRRSEQVEEAKNVEGAQTSAVAEIPSESMQEIDAKNGVVRVKPEVFYDLRILGPAVAPSEVTQVGDNLVVVDAASGSVYVSSSQTPKFEAEELTFVGVRDVAAYKGNLSFVDTEGHKVYDLATNKVLESYAKKDIGLSSIYSDFLYATKGGVLTRYTRAEGQLTDSLWGQSPDFDRALAMAIAYNVYLLTEDNLLSYTSGTKNDFGISGLSQPMRNPVGIYTTLDLDNIYIADSGNNRIIVVDKEGKFVRQYKAEVEETWGDIKDLYVTAGGEKLYLLNGTTVYEVKLTS